MEHCAEDIYTFLQANEHHVVEINIQWLRYACVLCALWCTNTTAKPWLKYTQCVLAKANKMADSCASNFDTILQLCKEAILWKIPRFNSIFCSAEVFLANSLLYGKFKPDTQTTNYYNPVVHACWGLINAWRAPTTSVCCADYRRRLPYLFVLVWLELATQEYHQYDHHCEDHSNSQNRTQDYIDVVWVVCIGLCEEEGWETVQLNCVTVFACYTLRVT